MENKILSKRSKFFNLAAVGIGTSEIECLTSYISRLSRTHNLSVGMFLSKAVWPEISSNKLLVTNPEQIGKKSSALNNYHESAKELLKILKALTTNNDLDLLTVFDFNNILHAYELGGKKKWCPDCLLNRKQLNKIIYHKLIWTFEIVEVCTRHRCKLVSSCFHCGATQYLLHPKSIEGYCQWCFSFLGGKGVEKVTNESGYLDWQEWIVNNIGALLSLNKHKRSIINAKIIADLIKSFLNKMKEVTGLNKKDIAIFGRFSDSNFCSWQRGEYYPSFYSLLRLCFMSNVMLIDLYGENYKISPSIRTLPFYVLDRGNVKNARKYGKEELKGKLNEIINDTTSPPPSLASVARQLGYKKPETIRAKLPSETDIIVNNYENYRMEMVNMNRKAIYLDIKTQVIKLLEQGIYPSITKLEKALDKPAIFRSVSHKEMLENIFKEMGVKRAKRYQ
jgi:hypothetical protein